MENLKVIVFLNKETLISRIDEVPSELGEPDCKLIDPYVIMSDKTLFPWFSDYTDQNTFMIHSDKILTIIDPNSYLIEKYTLINS